MGFEICEDAWNGVRPAQKHYLKNVDIILNPSASHFAFGKSKVREKLVTEASRSFCCAYVYTNLLGNEAGRIIYDGEILIAQNGILISRNKRFSYQEFNITSGVIDLLPLSISKKKSFNFLPEISFHLIQGQGELLRHKIPAERANLPEQIYPFESKEEEFYLAETLALFDYCRKSFSKGFVLSLSGGADSSACAVLIAHCFKRCIAEIGYDSFRQKLSYLNLPEEQPQNLISLLLTCVYQGTINSGSATLESAKELALGLGAEFHHWNIQPQLDQYHQQLEATIQRPLSWKTDDIPLQNIQARVRAPGIWMLANLKSALLVTTSNRSEAAVGYATMDGDTCGGLAPLGGIDKATLVQWLRWAETNLNLKELKYVNNLQPTAELRPPEESQTDEKDLMPYPILDKIEKCAIRDYKSPTEVFETLRGIVSDDLLKSYIRKFFRLWSINQWKRERYAPSFHLDDENLDPKTWCRFPILNSGYRQELEEL
ncbi:MAG: NAD(+) synthase [Bacteroidia bacterium]|nr:NAD(+) synthase [Bacteroidia bacterium]